MDILNKLKHFLSLNAKVLIYNSLILSHLNFSILTWGYQCYRKKIVRILNLSKYNAHTESIFKMLKLLKVNDILKLQEYNFFQNYFGQMRPIHEYARKCIRHKVPIASKALLEILQLY